MASSQVGLLIPVNKSFEEDDSVPRLPVFEGHNVVGRDNVPVADKRLSRKHLTLSASPHDHGSAHLLVEGMNPVVINSGGQKRRLNSGERVTIKNGDIIELIPGSYYFKYVTECDQGNSAMVSKGSGMGRECKDIGVGLKRMRDELDLGGSGVHFPVKYKSEMKVEEESSIAGNSETSGRSNVSMSGNNEEALRYFHIPDDKFPSTFRLMKVQGLPEWANTSCVSIDDVIKGDVVVAILSNYMVDIDWLRSACPALKKVPHVLVVHGEDGGVLEHMKRNKPSNWILHKPPLPISYGTHHSKAMLLIYPQGVRVVVHTANLISVDWTFKTQGLWMQDFPWKDQNEESTGCEFERDLVDYLQALKLPEVAASLPLLGRVNISASFFKKFNYKDAAVRLIASVPGYHSGPNLNMWGHMKLRSVLEQCTFDDEFNNLPLVYQLGVLFLPTLLKTNVDSLARMISVIPSNFLASMDLDDKELVDNSIRRTKLVTLQWSEGESADSDYEIVRLPVPYKLPPLLYSSQDVPWAWDRKYTKKDVHGQTWPRPVKLYMAQDL